MDGSETRRTPEPASPARAAADAVLEKVAEVREEVKPHLRGWLHAGTVPLAIAAGTVLIVLSPDAKDRKSVV